jgi:glycosyltransferase involved in cell wall biosynthesis
VYDQAKTINNTQEYNVLIIKVVSFFSKERDYTFKEFDVMVFKVFDLPFFVLPGIFNWLNSIRFRNFFQSNKLLGFLSVIHSHVSYPSAYLTNAVSLISKAKTIIQHHGIDSLQVFNGRFKLITRAQKSFIKKRSILQLNKIGLNVYVSKRVRNELHSYNTYNPKSEYVLYNGVDRTKFYNKGKQKNSDIYKIGCIANFWPIKDQISLIKAVHLLVEKGINDIRLHLIGSGETLDSCKEYVRSNILESYVYFNDEMSHHKLNDFYNSLDLFVLPSYYEALGCVFLEAWATDLPIISARNQGISELIPENELNNLLSKERSPESLKEKILGEYKKKRAYKFDNKYDIKNTISEFLKLSFFDD